MEIRNIWVLLAGILFTGCTSPAEDIVTAGFDFAQKQLKYSFTEIETTRKQNNKTAQEWACPRTLNPDGSLRLVPPRDWCSGFFPGELWYLYEYTKDDFWKNKAEEYTELLEPMKTYTGTHDLGFIMYCSFGNGLRLSPNERYRNILLETARSLMLRYDANIGCIRSWDFNREVWQYPVIIDNMMNLELLFWASKETGDDTFKQAAILHATTTMKHHFRQDCSSYHVIDYDTVTYLPRLKQTHQGYSDSSAWARGQAWGLYGYTLCYRETQQINYLIHAEKIADYIFANPTLPTDLIPYWDFNAPGIPGNEPRDVSAAMVTASALYELSTNSQKGKLYKERADKIMESVHHTYRASLHDKHGFLLVSSTGHKPKNSEIDVPLSYADYYYLEALTRKNKLENETNEKKAL